MWKREDTSRSNNAAADPAAASPEPPARADGVGAKREAQEAVGGELVHIGKSILIKGELSGGEDLTVEGQVEGKIELRDHLLTIGANGRIQAQIFAKSIVVLGQVTGNLSATEKVEIRENGSVEGDIVAPRVAIADGAHFRGSVDMQRKERPGSVEPAAASRIDAEPLAFSARGTSPD